MRKPLLRTSHRKLTRSIEAEARVLVPDEAARQPRPRAEAPAPLPLRTRP
jgi:hypothetical protein